MSNTICKHWDCGWCYHPTLERNNGCIGSDKCEEYTKPHQCTGGETMTDKVCYASNKGGGAGTSEPFCETIKPHQGNLGGCSSTVNTADDRTISKDDVIQELASSLAFVLHQQNAVDSLCLPNELMYTPDELIKRAENVIIRRTQEARNEQRWR